MSRPKTGGLWPREVVAIGAGAITRALQEANRPDGQRVRWLDIFELIEDGARLLERDGMELSQ